MSSIVAIALAIGIGNVIYWASGRRKIKRFFNLGSGGVVVYTSRLEVGEGGSSGVDRQRRSYEGAAMPEYELRAVTDIEDFIGKMRPQLHQVSGPLSFLRFQWSDVHVQVELAPADIRDVNRSATLFVIGSPAYNVVSALVESDFEGIGAFSTDFREMLLPDKEPLDGTQFAMVQRRIHPVSGQRAFYAAGFSVAGTEAASGYVIREWSRLFKAHGHDLPFTVVLELPQGEPVGMKVFYEAPMKRSDQ